MRTARRAVNTYWRLHWSDHFTGEYEAPDVVGLYDSEKGDTPLCGEERLPENNAVYCPDDNYVAWDKVLMKRGEQLGDAWVYLIIAHEWGHAVQAQLNEQYVSEESELQADCLAAAELYGADKDGNFTFEEGDLNEVVDALQDVADDTPWTSIGDHGDATERIAAFQRGKKDGVDGCFEHF